MTKRKLILESIINKAKNEESDSDSNEDDSDLDSDSELQRAFAAGELKPGLNGLVAFKRTQDEINDKESLNKKLEEISIFKDNWLERLDLICEPAKVTPQLIHQYGDLDLKVNRKGEISGEEITDDKAQNDFKRELLFYRQAQTAAIECINRLHNKYRITQTRRPDDYFAEMVKTDDHMKKVRERLQAKQNSIEASEKAKRLRELKKYGKKVQQEVQLKRQQEKKDLLQKINNYKKGKEESLDFLDDENDSKPDKQSKSNNHQNANKKSKTTKKQMYKEARYGYGGQKKRSKYNNSDSAANFSGFSVRKHGRPNMKKNRPGKNRRQKSKNNK